MSTNEKKSLPLKHYTSIENLYKILESSCLLLKGTEKWSDKNDTASVNAFCRKKGSIAKVICFTQDDEIHHWKTYAKKGCCICFDDEILFKDLDPHHFLRKEVKYLNSKDLTKTFLEGVDTNKLPFLKRSSYECEGEYRVVWFGQKNETKNAKIQFNINKAIKRIILAPGLKNREEHQEHIKKKYGIKVDLSRIEKSEDWISKFNQIAKSNKKHH